MVSIHIGLAGGSGQQSNKKSVKSPAKTVLAPELSSAQIVSVLMPLLQTIHHQQQKWKQAKSTQAFRLLLLQLLPGRKFKLNAKLPAICRQVNCKAELLPLCQFAASVGLVEVQLLEKSAMVKLTPLGEAAVIEYSAAHNVSNHENSLASSASSSEPAASDDSDDDESEFDEIASDSLTAPPATSSSAATSKAEVLSSTTSGSSSSSVHLESFTGTHSVLVGHSVSTLSSPIDACEFFFISSRCFSQLRRQTSADNTSSNAASSISFRSFVGCRCIPS
jgi:hypothetical protein